MDTSESLTERARRALGEAYLHAYRYRTGYVGTKHLLLGLVQDAEDAVAQTFDALGVPVTRIRQHLETVAGPAQQPRPFRLPYSSAARSALECGRRVAKRFGQFAVVAEHILYGLSLETESTAAKTLRDLGVDPHHISVHLVRQWDHAN